VPVKLKNLVIDRVDLVDQGANQHAHVLIAKRNVRKEQPGLGGVHVNKPIGEDDDDWSDEYDKHFGKAVMTSGERNALPDSAFAAVWTDTDGHKQRKFPFKRKDGSIDKPHLRNALARIEQNPKVPAGIKAKAKAKLQAAASKAGVGEQKRKRHMEKNIVKRLLSLVRKEAAFGDESSSSSSNSSSASAAKAFGDESSSSSSSSSSSTSSSSSSSSSMEKKLPDAHMKYLKGLHGHLEKMGAANDGSALGKLHSALGELLAGYGDQPGADDGTRNITEDVTNEGGPDPWGREPGSRNSATKRLLRKRDRMFSKRTEAAEKRAKAAEDKANAIEKKMTKDRVTSVLKKFKGVTVDPEKDVDFFMELEEKNAPLHKRVMEILTGADAAVAKSAVFGEVGTGRSGEVSSAWQRIEAEADKLMEKSDKKISKQKAITRVMEKNPELVKEYYAETGVRQ